MKNYKKILLAAAATLAFDLDASAADKLRIGTEGAYPPFNGIDASGQAVGFDLDIGKALCAKMKTECEVVTSDWDGIIPALNAKKFDFIVASMSITDERKQAVDFTDPYYTNKRQGQGESGDHRDRQQLQGQRRALEHLRHPLEYQLPLAHSSFLTKPRPARRSRKCRATMMTTVRLR